MSSYLEHDGWYDDNGTWIEESPRVENYIKNSETIEIDLDRFSDLSGRIRASGETRNAAASGPADDCLPSLTCPAHNEGSAKQENKSLPLPSADSAAVGNQRQGKKTQSQGNESPKQAGSNDPSTSIPGPMNNYAQNFRAEYSTDPLGMMGAYGEVLARAGYQIEAQRDGFIEGKGRDFFAHAIQTLVMRKTSQGKAAPVQITWGMNCQIPLMLHSPIFKEGFDAWLKHYGVLIQSGKIESDSKYTWPRYVSMLLEKLSRVFMDPNPQGGWMLARVGTSQEFWYPNHYKLRHYFKDRAARGWLFPWDFEKIESKKEYRQEWGAQISWSEYALFKNQPWEWQTVWNTIRDIRAAKRLRGG